MSERSDDLFWLIASTVVAAFMTSMLLIVRMKAAKKPITAKRIVLPPLFMSTGALMFLFPIFRIEWIQVLEALVVGIICSIFLIKTSKFEMDGKDIYLKPSRAFPLIIIGLLVLRLSLKLIVGSQIAVGETSGMFFLLAFGMIITWRFSMLYKYMQLKKVDVEEMRETN